MCGIWLGQIVHGTTCGTTVHICSQQVFNGLREKPDCQFSRGGGGGSVLVVSRVCVCVFKSNIIVLTCMSMQGCTDCKGKTELPLALYFLLLFVVVGIVFVLLLVLNVGITPPLDTWLLLSQVLWA